MGSFKIKGGNRLKGDLIPQGAKNEALQVICAILLTPREVIIRNIPEINDVINLIGLISDMGVRVIKKAQGEYSFCAEQVNIEYLQSEAYRSKSTSLRGSVMIIGPLLARFGKGYIPKPGGDRIGRRRLDTHFDGFQKLGAKFK